MSARLRERELRAMDEPEASPSAAPGAVPRLAVAHSAEPDARTNPRSSLLPRLLNPARLAFLATAMLLYWGHRFPTELYITPQTGAGYALGIVGGFSMLLLLVYPARKRFRWLGFMGTTKRWFQAHMVLGIVGPVLVLFHSNFSLGATNSNVALACMLIVSGSGLFGRYFYSRIHHGLHGRRASLAELKAYAEKLRWVTTNVEFLPDLVSRIESEEQRIVTRCERLPLLVRPAACAIDIFIARRRLRAWVRNSLRSRAAQAAQSRRQGLLETAAGYIDDRLSATRRVVEFSAFERLFSLWHALHLPLFLMLLLAGAVHVAAVHVY
jgi:hypothetical protein